MGETMPFRIYASIVSFTKEVAVFCYKHDHENKRPKYLKRGVGGWGFNFASQSRKRP